MVSPDGSGDPAIAPVCGRCCAVLCGVGYSYRWPYATGFGKWQHESRRRCGVRGSSMSDIGQYNERLVLQTIRSAADPIGQAEVVRRSQLSRQAVSLITRRLLADGLIEHAGRRVNGPGKPSTLLRVVASARLAVGVHLDPVHITVVICDLAARPLARSVLGPPTAAPEEDIARIAAEIDVLRRSLPAASAADLPASPDGSRPILLGIGIAAPAPLDSVAGIVREPPWMPGWRRVPVVEALHAATGLPAMLDKDTNAALTGEIWTRHLPTDETVLYLYIGHGIGSAVSTDGRVHRGGSTQAGEIGHLPTGWAQPMCECGRYGCQSLYTDAHVLIERARADGVTVPPGTVMREALELVSAAAADGHTGALEALVQHGTALGATIRTLADIHDPRRIIIGGPIWPALRSVALPPVQDQLRTWLEQSSAVLEPTHLGDNVGAIGAACLFLEQKLAPGSVGSAAGWVADRQHARVGTDPV